MFRLEPTPISLKVSKRMLGSPLFNMINRVFKISEPLIKASESFSADLNPPGLSTIFSPSLNGKHICQKNISAVSPHENAPKIKTGQIYTFEFVECKSDFYTRNFPIVKTHTTYALSSVISK